MPRRPKGVLLPPIPGTRPRRASVYAALRNAVLDGVLAPGERLPSSRQAAADYGVSRGLLEEVYSQLMEEGFLERGVGRGTFVARQVARLPVKAPGTPPPRQARAPSRRGARLAGNLTCREPDVFRPFNAGVADTAEFPWKIWQRIQARSVRELRRADMNFADPRGLPALRNALAHHLAQLRGVRCTPDQVIVFNSAQQALYSLALLLLDPGDRAWLEDPGYPGARTALELAGADIVYVPVDHEGLRVEAGIQRAPQARLAYVTPPHQYPTGSALSLERRIALLDWAERQDAWVLEDDYDGEFRYEGQPLTALHSLDQHGRVVYLGTLSKSMFVSLRLAFAVVPESIVEELANIRTQLDAFSAPLAQLAMSRFMDEGHFSAHVRRMRGVYAAKCAQLTGGLAPLAARGWNWPEQTVGMHLLLRHPDAAEVRRTAAASGLDLRLLNSYRHRAARDDGLLLRFGGLSPAAIDAGVQALVTAASGARP
ncbi:MAG TPA: PLP-dependent aminotransferase family protein [Gammaproteobacteria bacterium]|nr:PLP-dependent aminotransferase family protein [Gammaproteobacteria bacterium]